MSETQKPETIHRRQLFDGRATAEEVHRELAFPPDARCACGSPKVAVRARVFLPTVVLVEKLPGLAMSLALPNGGKIPCTEFRGPGGLPVKFARVGDAYACDLCRSALELALARGTQDPALRGLREDMVVHFDYGPGVERPVVQVPAQLDRGEVG